MKTFPLTIIIPVHELTEETTPLLQAALESVKNQKDYQPEAIMVVKGINEPSGTPISGLMLDIFGKSLPKVVVFQSESAALDIASQVNRGIQEATTEFVTVLELDDELSLEYIGEMAKYVEAYPDVEGFLPLVACVDPTASGLLKYGNEALWVPKNAEERPEGYVDAETCEVAPDLLLSGAMLKKHLYTDGYGLKTNIKLTFVNEFYRRLVGRGSVLRGMGKVLYMHRERRPGSYMYDAMLGENALTKPEIDFYLEAARTESAFEIERPLSF